MNARFCVLVCLALATMPRALRAGPVMDTLAPEAPLTLPQDEGDAPAQEVGDLEVQPPRPAILAYAGEAIPWTAYGIIAEFPDREFPFFVAAGAGRFRQSALEHDHEELDVKALARSISAGGQWAPLSRVFSFRAALGLTAFSGSLTQRGTDVSADPTAADLLGTGFGGHVLHGSLSGVFAYERGRLRFEFVPVGFRFTVWRSITQDRATPHQVGLNRYLGGNTVFGLVNLAVGTSF